MGEKRQSSKQLKKCIADTFFKLLEEKPYDEIKIYEICEKSFVGRTSFYRYFESKEEIILFYLNEERSKYVKEYGIKNPGDFTLDNTKTFFEYGYTMRDKLNLIHKNNLDSIMVKNFTDTICKDDELGYERSFYSYGLFALEREWWRRGYKETPEELADLFIKFYKKGAGNQ